MVFFVYQKGGIIRMEKRREPYDGKRVYRELDEKYNREGYLPPHKMKEYLRLEKILLDVRAEEMFRSE